MSSLGLILVDLRDFGYRVENLELTVHGRTDRGFLGCLEILSDVITRLREFLSYPHVTTLLSVLEPI